MKKAIKVVLKVLTYVLCLPVLLLVNPFSMKVFKWFKHSFLEVYYSLYFHRKIGDIKSHGLIFMTGKKYIHIGKKVRFGRYCKMDGIFVDKEPSLEIKDHVFIMNNVHIGCCNHIVIGNNTVIGSNVLIEDHSHGSNEVLLTDHPKIENKLFSKGEIVIGNNVWICDNVVILPGVVIGDNSVIGAGAIVSHNVPQNSIYAGNPAKLIRSK